jgi:hypothetical protein
MGTAATTGIKPPIGDVTPNALPLHSATTSISDSPPPPPSAKSECPIEKSEVEAVAPWIAIALGRVSELINLSLICVSLTQKETYFVKGTRNEQGLKKISNLLRRI